ncbi:hemin ABC transporter substrate-binding protein [Aestuariibius sp. 2305UL40-4]|uniref:heme/hemin ABC transporter substrate-binding protein n=1 Tax=Aestuariibius violaceus TaxID=3234132 RepID=UPI00345E26C7
MRATGAIATRSGTALLATLMAIGWPLAAKAEPSRVVALGGSVTEIIYALGEEERLIARDTTSVYPEAATDLPDVGYMRALSAEGVLSVEPNLILAEEGAGPPEVVDILENARIPFVTIPDDYSPDGILAKIDAVGAALDVMEKAQDLRTEVAADLSSANSQAESLANGGEKRVLFILSLQDGRVMASGTNTAAHGIIEMAGAENAVTSFTGYKLLTDEALAAAAPDAILMMDRTGDHAATNEDLFAIPALSLTPAAEAEAVIRMNGLYLLGFGPRTAEAVRDLSVALYGG